jgi:prepilin-type N-terminal cleavage/methylation domain-containing protein
MPARRFREESGYSLVEVMVSIMLLAIAILPMAAMIDMGLNSTTVASKYDKARMLANLKLEEAKNLPHDTVRDNFPEPATTYDAGTGFYQSDWKDGPGADFANIKYRVEKQHMAQFPTDSDGSETFEPSATATGLIRVTVTVGWDSDGDGEPDRTLTTHGLVAQ